MSRRSTFSGFGIGGGWTPAVRSLVIACGVAFLLQLIDSRAGTPSFTYKFGLTPALVTENFYLWQLVTYIFLHGGLFHILFNMLGLYMFGSELEQLWGTREFTKFFFICGIGAAIISVLISPHSGGTIIGASGAIFGVLVAYGLLFPNRIIYLYMVIPITAKWFVIIMGAINFVASLSANAGGVAYITHVGGMLVGFLYLKSNKLFSGLKWRYDRWQRNRLRRKFDVYYNERRRDDDDDETKWKRWRN